MQCLARQPFCIFQYIKLLKQIDCLSQDKMSNQKKLVQALKVFMERSVAPALGERHSALNEWKYLSGILSNEPVDSAQLDFYLLMANKGSNTASNSGISSNSAPQKMTYQLLQTNTQKFGMNRFPVSEVQSPTRPKGNLGVESQRKQLLGNMINFQTNMMRNQEKLQNFNKKEPNSSVQLNSSSNTSYTGSKKFM